MDSASPFHVWIFRGTFVLLAAGIILTHLLPLSTLPSTVPAPDVLSILVLAWILRRPEYVPIFLIAGVLLFSDLFLMRPPGLFAAFIVIAAEVVRARGLAFYEMPFSFEWFLVGVALTVAYIANHIVLVIVLPNAPSLGLVIIQLVFTILMYPIVVVISRSLFGVRRRHPGEVDTAGLRG